MKFFILFISVLFFTPAWASQQLLDCNLYKLYDSSEFEESLSTFEYPKLYLEKGTDGLYEVTIGGSAYSEPENKITYEFNDDEYTQVLRIESEAGVYEMVYSVSDEESSGTLTFLDYESQSKTSIGKFVCGYVDGLTY